MSLLEKILFILTSLVLTIAGASLFIGFLVFVHFHPLFIAGVVLAACFIILWYAIYHMLTDEFYMF